MTSSARRHTSSVKMSWGCPTPSSLHQLWSRMRCTHTTTVEPYGTVLLSLLDQMSAPAVYVVLGRGAQLSSISRDEKIALLREHGGILWRGFEVESEGFREL